MAVALAIPGLCNAGEYFNQFHGGCPGAAYRERLVRTSLIGTWTASGHHENTYAATEHFVSAEGRDREKDCYDCCLNSYDYEATVTFRGSDAFGNVTGTYRTEVSQHTAEAYQDYLSRHNRVYRIDCGEPHDNHPAGRVTIGLEIINIKEEPGFCMLSRMPIRYDGVDENLNVDMVDPTSFKRSDGRIYRKG